MPAATVGEEEEEEEEEVKETEGPKRREWRVDIRCASLAATHCNTLQHTAAHCNTLQTARHCNKGWICGVHLSLALFFTLRHTVTHCNTLQHTMTHCNTLQHTATHCNNG